MDMDMDMVDMDTMDTMARGLLMPNQLLLLSQDMDMVTDMAMDTVMDMAMVDMVIMDTMARGMLMPSQGMAMVMDMVMDMDMVAMDMVMAMDMDMDMVMVMDMVMDTMVKQQLFNCSKSSVKEVDLSESSQKRHKIKI